MIPLFQAWFQRLLCLLCVISMAVFPWSGTAVAQPTGLPSLGDTSSVELSPSVERKLGDAIMEQGRRDPSYISDLAVNQYLTNLARQLLRQTANTSGNKINVFAIRDAEMNAFAMPGGYIGIHSGLLAAAHSESELASVVAHEMAHVLQRHIARGMTQSAQSSHIVLATLAGALLAALSGSGDLAMGVAAFGQAAAIDRQLGFSRQAEQEADRLGLQMLQRAGFDAQGMVDMFGRLADASRLNEGAGGNIYTSTHPLSLQRMSDIQSRIQSRNSHQDTEDFIFVRAKVLAMQAHRGQGRDHALERLRQDSRKGGAREQAAGHYGLATYAWLMREPEQARKAISQSNITAQENPYVASLELALLMKEDKADAALRLADQARQRWPNHQGLLVEVAKVWQQAGRHKQTLEAMQQASKKWPDAAQFYRLKADSLEAMGERVESRRAMARYYELEGALVTAVEYLQQAQGLSKDFYQQSELDVQIRELKDRLKSQRKVLKRFEKRS